MKVTVVYASEIQQKQIELEVPFRCLLRHAIERSGILKAFPEINLSINKVGIFGRLQSLETLLEPGDRVEIYRPLKMDPKELRRLKARKK
ncbi:MAG TPA: RnfH family protein [Coxiellaceae bacterium]|nr:RnfH family protein [Coxiellaceae bacterium]